MIGKFGGRDKRLDQVVDARRAASFCNHQRQGGCIGRFRISWWVSSFWLRLGLNGVELIQQGLRRLAEPLYGSALPQTGFDLDSRPDLVGQAKRQCFRRGEPGFSVDHAPQLDLVDVRRLGLVRRNDGFQRLVQHIGDLAQVLGITGCVGPRVVDHQHGVGRHDHAVCATRGNTPGTGRQRIDPRRAALTQAVQRIVNCQTVEQVATDGVERCHDGRHAVINGFQVLNELIGRNAPAADLTVDVDLDGGLLGLGFSLDAVPVLVLDRQGNWGLVENAKRQQRFHGFSFSSGSSSSADKVV